jgi:hypothetical protein
MRRWGRVPICKNSRPEHEMGMQTHETLLRKERKEVIHGKRKICTRKKIQETNLEKRKEHLQLFGSRKN